MYLARDLGTTSPTGFRSIQDRHLYIILYFVMLLSECFTKVVYPHVRNHQFPTFIVLTDTSKHAQQIGDALLHHLTCNDTWPDLIQYDDMHTPDILTTLWPTGKYNKQLFKLFSYRVVPIVPQPGDEFMSSLPTSSQRRTKLRHSHKTYRQHGIAAGRV